MTYESELSKKLKTMPEFVLTHHHIGLVEVKSERGNYLQDKWSVTLFYNGQHYTTEYSAGIGNRKQSSSVQKDRRGYYNKISGDFKNEREACEAGWLKLVPPTVVDIVSCLLVDASCIYSTFEDYCSEFGVDPDSRKGLETYLACQKTLVAMRNMLGAELFQELSQLEH